MDTATAEFRLGEGLYSFPEAARILGRRGEGAKPATLRYWLKTGLTPATGRTDYGFALTFADLVSLEIVRRFRSRGVSLQRVRRLDEGLREEHPSMARPFAHEVFYTDGMSIWLAENPGDPDGLLTEMVGRQRRHLAWAPAIQSFASEIRYDPETHEAVSWLLSEWVEVNPAIQFGAPVVRGTRTPARTVLANLEAGTPAEVADWYGLTVEQVDDVRKYYAAA